MLGAVCSHKFRNWSISHFTFCLYSFLKLFEMVFRLRMCFILRPMSIHSTIFTILMLVQKLENWHERNRNITPTICAEKCQSYSMAINIRRKKRTKKHSNAKNITSRRRVSKKKWVRNTAIIVNGAIKLWKYAHPSNSKIVVTVQKIDIVIAGSWKRALIPLSKLTSMWLVVSDFFARLLDSMAKRGEWTWCISPIRFVSLK